MNKKKLKICIVSFPIGKAFVTPLINLEKVLSSFSDRIYRITGTYENNLINNNNGEIKIYNIYYKKTTKFLERISRYFFLQLKISYLLFKLSKKIDVVLFFMEGDAILPEFMAFLLNKEIIRVLPSNIIIHNTTPRKDFLSLLANYARFISFSLSKKIIIYSSNLIKEWDLSKFENKVFFAHEHFVSFDLFRKRKQVDQRQNIIGYIGRLSSEKGVLNFVKAIPELLKERDDLYFLIGGDGELKNYIRNYITKKKLGNKIRFIGWIDHEKLPDYFNQMKLVVVPSFTEGLPNVILEAMACGTIVLATPVGAITDFITDGETGFLLENNQPKIIAKNIIRVIDSPNLELIANNTIDLLKKEFTYEAAVERYKKALGIHPTKKTAEDMCLT